MRHHVSHSNQQQAKVELDGNRLFSFRRAFKTCLFILYMAATLRPAVVLCFNVSHVQTGLQIYFASYDSYFTHHQLTMSSLAVTNGLFHQCHLGTYLWPCAFHFKNQVCSDNLINRAMRQQCRVTRS